MNDLLPRVALLVVLLATAAYAQNATGRINPRATAPARCRPTGEVYFNTTDKKLYRCTAVNTWTETGGNAGLNLRDFGARCDDSTDDSLALQTAVNLASTLGVRKVIVPYSDKPCIVHDITLPSYPGSVPLQALTIEGEQAPPFTYGTVAGTLQVATKGSILKTVNSTGTIITATSPLSAVDLTLRNLVLRGPDNSSVTIVDGRLLYGLILENVVVDTGRYTTNIVQPVNPSRGVVMPTQGNGAHSYIRNLAVGGYNIGLTLGEHDNGDQIVLHANMIGLKQGDSAHPQRLGRVLFFNNAINIDFATTSTYAGGLALDINQADFEHTDVSCNPTLPSWMFTTVDVRDTAGLGRGTINYGITLGCVGPVSTLPLRSGGNEIRLQPLREAGTKLSLGGGIFWMRGAGPPENVVAGIPGCLYSDTTNGKLWVKESGTGPNGWVQK